VGWTKRDVRFLSTMRFDGRGCPPAIWVDGMLMRDGADGISGDQAATLDDLLPSPSSIETIELYRSPAGVPPQFNINAMCGVILAWTRR